MTIVVTSIIAIPLSLLISQHMVSLFESRDHTMALNLARFEMERVNNMSYPNIRYDSISIGSTSFVNYQGYDYDVTRIVAYAQGSNATTERLKRITVRVTKHGSATVLVSLVTYIARNITYGI